MIARKRHTSEFVIKLEEKGTHSMPVFKIETAKSNYIEIEDGIK